MSVEGQPDETETAHKTHYAIKPARPENWNCYRVVTDKTAAKSRANDLFPVSAIRLPAASHGLAAGRSCDVSTRVGRDKTRELLAGGSLCANQ